MSDQDDDALIEDLLDEALSGMDAVAAAPVLAAIREVLGDTLATTPTGRQLLRQIRPDPVVASTGDVAAPGANEAPAAPHAKKASG
ncbi:MAG: hypothetical protein U0271_36135 [Polyangiaceae bacterium]